jgi:peptide/nickel transport system substrate-binding protein
MHAPALSTVRRCTTAFLMLSIAACRSQDVGPHGPTGGTVIISTPGDATTLVPELSQSVTDREVSDLLYDHLAEIGANLNTLGDAGFRPQLADRWTWSADSLDIAFHVNPGARWHDGVPVRASDVAYSIRLAQDPSVGAASPSFMRNFAGVTVQDSQTAVVRFKQHTPEQFYDLVYQIAIVPQHILGSVSPQALKTADVARAGIGSGRFRLARWTAGQTLELVADTTNYRGRPGLDRVLLSIASDGQAAAARFMAGDADLLEHVPPPLAEKLAHDSAHRVVSAPDLGYGYLAFNLHSPTAPTQPHPIFQDIAVRRALTMAVNRPAMLANVFGATGRMAHGPFSSRMPIADTTIAQIPFDTVAARALLDSAGWPVGPDGIRMKHGQRLAFNLLIPTSSALRRQYAVLLQAAFARVGAAVNIDQMDFPSMITKERARAYDAEIAMRVPEPSLSSTPQGWTMTGSPDRDRYNLTGYANPVVAAALDSATATFNPVAAKRYARTAFATIIADAPGIWLFESVSLLGVQSRIVTAPMRADGWWSSLATWSIPAAAQTARDHIGLRTARAP